MAVSNNPASSVPATSGSATVAPTPSPLRRMSDARILWLGIYLTATFVGQIALLIGFWPPADGTSNKTWPCPFASDGCPITDEGRTIVIVLLAGGIGAMVHAVRSFSAHVGSHSLAAGWGWWYFLRPLECAVVALAFYLVLGGGLVQAGSASTAGTASVYAMAGLSVLVGMFSHEAVTKLKEVAETFFSKASSTVKDEPAAQALPKPTITTLDPEDVKQSAVGARIKVVGTGFTEKSMVRIQGTDRTTEFKSATEIVATLAPEDTKDANKDLKISVFNPAPGGGESTEEKKVRVIQ
jgi:hypothetical protein